MTGIALFAASLLLLPLCISALADDAPLPGTAPLTETGDLAAKMVDGIDRYLMQATEEAKQKRPEHWKLDKSSPEAYAASLAPHREHLGRLIGLTDKRLPAHLEIIGAFPATNAAIGEGTGYKVYAVRWSVLEGVDAEGLLLLPDGKVKADIVALPDADNTPEQLVGLTKGVAPAAQFARRFAENGCRVLVPMLIDRKDTFSGMEGIGFTNEPHREFLYRAAYMMGRTPIAYEVQKVMAAVDWFQGEGKAKGKTFPLGLFGYGEGGLIAFYAGALDTRFQSVGVSGYFGPREGLWSEPIYRNVYGLLEEFGDAEIAALVNGRMLVVEESRQPEVSGSPKPSPGHSNSGAPGKITNPPFEKIRAEFDHFLTTYRVGVPNNPTVLVPGNRGTEQPGTELTLTLFLKPFGIEKPVPSGAPPKPLRKTFGEEARMKRQFGQLMAHTQKLMHDSPGQRAAYWKQSDASSVEKWKETSRPYREQMWDNLIGRLPAATMPPNPRSRVIYKTPAFTGYEVMLDVYPDVYAYGILLVPNDIKPGEHRPVVVCQHGLEGRPQDVANPAVDNEFYHRFACQLAEKGYITFAPQNPYIGEDRFRVLLRKAQPLGKTLFSFIVRQHERILDWLETLPFVDSKRMAFYGLSYGGKTAMRVPALLERYCLSICSADYNEWVWKNADMNSGYCYLYNGEYDMPEWNLANTFNYAEMSWLICPRPFMVERGHADGVAPDEWVSYEFAKTFRRYDLLGLGKDAELEIFDGPHTIHGKGTFAFLDRYLKP